MLISLNLNQQPQQKARLPPFGNPRHKLKLHYNKRRKQAHRLRLFLETVCTVFYTIETKFLMFGVIALVWVLVDVTMLIADDAE